MEELSFDIAQFHTSIAIRPLPHVERISVQHGNVTRIVETDNVASVRREVTFADAMQPDRVFEIRYSTQSGGFVKSHWEGAENLAGSADLGRYDDYGTECLFAFVPVRGRLGPYSLEVEVIGGFGAGHRDVHFHLGKNRRYRKLTYTLDLTSYTDSGYWVSDGPRLLLHGNDPQHRELDRLSRMDDFAPVHPQKPGLWYWEFHDVEGGLVDIRWNIEPSQPRVPVAHR